MFLMVINYFSDDKPRTATLKILIMAETIIDASELILKTDLQGLIRSLSADPSRRFHKFCSVRRKQEPFRNGQLADEHEVPWQLRKTDGNISDFIGEMCQSSGITKSWLDLNDEQAFTGFIVILFLF